MSETRPAHDGRRRPRRAGSSSGKLQRLPAAPRPDPLCAARFVERPNRFLVRARLADGEVVDAHLSDPGRLAELLVPDSELRLRPAEPRRGRRTIFSVALVRAASSSRAWVSLETARANALAHGLLATGAISGLEQPWEIHREVSRGASRFDFLLDAGSRRVWVEVKSVTLVRDGVALFPDAPTRRGRRHVEELTGLVARGEPAMVLFVVQRSDATAVAPHAALDPDFAAALTAARETGVVLRAACFGFDAAGRVIECRTLPVRA